MILTHRIDLIAFNGSNINFNVARNIIRSDRLEMKFLIVLTLLCAGISGDTDRDIVEDVEKVKEMLAKSGKFPLIRIHFFV